MISEVPLPQFDEDSEPFWEGCARGELLVQRCSGCGVRRVPPRPMCPSCNSLGSEWEQMSGRGRIWSVVTPHPPLLPAFAALAEKAPYNVVVVELDEDPTLRLVGNVVAAPDAGINSVDASTIEIGDAVHVVFDSPVDDEHGSVTFPRWVRDSSA